MSRRILTQLSGHQVLLLIKRMRDWIKSHEGGLEAFLEATGVTHPKLRLQYRVAFSMAKDWVDEKLPCDFDNIRTVLVWGKTTEDENLQLEYRLKEPVAVTARRMRRVSSER